MVTGVDNVHWTYQMDRDMGKDMLKEVCWGCRWLQAWTDPLRRTKAITLANTRFLEHFLGQTISCLFFWNYGYDFGM